MYRKFLLLLFLGLYFWAQVVAQQAAQYSLYMLNPYAYNPAYAGLDQSLSITGVVRQQWTGIDKSPATQNLNFHLPIAVLSSGFGINFENDMLGAEHNINLTAAYSYHAVLSANTILAIAAGGGVFQKQLDGTILRTPQGDYKDGVVNHNDNTLFSGKESALKPTFNAGIYLQHKTFNAGFSVIHLSEPMLDYNGKTTIHLLRQYFATVGMDLKLFEKFSLRPSILFKSDLKQHQVDCSAIIRYNDNIFVGASFRGYDARTKDAVAILAGFKLNDKLTLGYAYDLGVSSLKTVHSGSHEFILKYNLNKVIGGGKPERIIYNPRLL